MSEETGDQEAPVPAGGPANPKTRVSSRMSMHLVGGVAVGGLGCMCALIAALALWRAS